MKKTIILFALSGVFCLAKAQIKVENDGTVGIGTTTPSTSYNLEIKENVLFNTDGDFADLEITDYYNGYVNVSTFRPTSDAAGWLGQSDRKFFRIYVHQLYRSYEYSLCDSRYKKDIKQISGALDKVCALQGVTYNFNANYYKNMGANKKASLKDEEPLKYGFIAQEVENILPDLVIQDETDSIYRINTEGIIPLLVEALKEQQIQIEELQKQIINNENKKSGSQQSDISSVNSDLEVLYHGAQLEQNKPNPFNIDTEIEFSIPETANSAGLYIYDMQGKQEITFPISSKGKSSIVITASQLDPGMYFYSLIIDGIEIDTKKMIITE